MAEIQVDPIIEAVYGPPPPGLDLNDDNYFIYNIVAIVFFIVAVLSVILRAYVRMTRGAGLAMDDYTIVGAIQMVYAEPWIYATAVTVTRVSILLLYHRLFDTNTTSNMVYIWQTRFAIGLTAAYPFVMYIGVCIDVLNFYLAFGVLNLINDVVILALPIPTIAKLHMDWKKKLSIMGIMLLGAFSCVSSLIRIFYLARLASSKDVTWWFGPGMGWSCIEPSTAIITACLPTLAPLFRKNKPSTGGSSNNYYRSADGGTKATRRGGDTCAAERGQQEWDKIDDDDEIELTGAQRHVRASSYSPSGMMDNDMTHPDGGITVETQVDVSSSHSQVSSGQVWQDKSSW
ncbi:hypothetical protein PG997_015447 [Apiospora hydei]|uniref:Rhodopsin domain-containing protein n=1 Tax=Apiospora hydei TaxID=1337664 RepID=A0ABR1UQM6_9PEZI